MNNFVDFCAGDKINGDRPYQEDWFAYQVFNSDSGKGEVLMVLADGMGGHAGGAEASYTAASCFLDHFGETQGDAAARLRECLDVANQAIESRVTEDISLANMGCTLVGCLVTGDDVYWVSVGDSPLWLLEDGGLVRLNEDHSMRPYLEALVEAGQMTEEELADDYRVHQLRSAVMGDELALVDQNKEPMHLSAGQKLILASDGLETISEAEIAKVCADHDNPSDAVRALLNAVEEKRRTHQDNATALIYWHTESSDFLEMLKRSEEMPTLVNRLG